MNVLIIEDEVPAAEKLERYLLKYDNTIRIAAKLDTVRSATDWLGANQDQIDLIFMDIQLIERDRQRERERERIFEKCLKCLKCLK